MASPNPDPSPATLAQVLQRRDGQAPALRFGGQSLGFGALQEAAARAAAVAWSEWGVRPGERVAWLGANHPGQPALLFGLARIGAILLPAPLIEAFHARGVPVCNVYGATETGPFSIALPPEHAMDHVGSCGWPAPGVEARLGAAHGDAAELLLRGPNIVARYWPDQPACDAQGWFATGDLAQRDADGSWRIVGRAKDLIISGGENFHPAEVEQALAAHPAVAECAAFALPDARWGEVVAVAVLRVPGSNADEPLLRAHLEQRLARFKLPRRWFFVPELPKTALGKVQRGALATQLA